MAMSYVNLVDTLHNVSIKGDCYVIAKGKIWVVFYQDFNYSKDNTIEYTKYSAMKDYLELDNDTNVFITPSAYEANRAINKTPVKTSSKTIEDEIKEKRIKEKQAKILDFM